jgi:hypothetical protein
MSTNRENQSTPPTFPSTRRNIPRGSGVDRPAPVSAYRTHKSVDDGDYLPEAAGLSRADMPNLSPREREQVEKEQEEKEKEKGGK